MSRHIDQLPIVESEVCVKLIVASCSRSGTLGLYQALKILGYRPYHMLELATIVGLPHMNIFIEALLGKHNRFSGIKRYGSPEYHKWFAGYDALVEIPSYLGTDVIESYLKDPDVKFILTERDPDKWVNSMKSSVGELIRDVDKLPLVVLKHFEYWANRFFYLNQLLYWVFSNGRGPDDKDAHENMKRNYIEYINTVKATVPPERLLVICLEDGLGWKEICPFLELPIPDVDYPGRNEPEKFKAAAEAVIVPHIKAAMLRVATLVVPIVGVVIWLALRCKIQKGALE